MPIDLSMIKKKLNPPVDGEDVLRLRAGVIDTVNPNGTCDVIISGVIVPNIARLDGVYVVEDMTVHILSYRGNLLIIGRTAGDGGPGGDGTVARGSSPSSSAAIGNTETSVLATSTGVFRAGRAYEVHIGGRLAASVGNVYPRIRIRKTDAAGQLLGEVGRPFIFTSATSTFTFKMSAIFTVGAADISAVLAMTVQSDIPGSYSTTVTADATMPRYIYAKDLDPASRWPDNPVLV